MTDYTPSKPAKTPAADGLQITARDYHAYAAQIHCARVVDRDGNAEDSGAILSLRFDGPNGEYATAHLQVCRNRRGEVCLSLSHDATDYSADGPYDEIVNDYRKSRPIRLRFFKD